MSLRGSTAQEFVREVDPPILTVIDFVNDVYTIDGVAYTATDVVGAGNLGRISASGLSITSGFTEVNIAAGDFKNLFLTANWTVVLEIELTALNDSSSAVHFLDVRVGATGRTTVMAYDKPFKPSVFDRSGTPTREAREDLNTWTLGIVKMAVSRKDSFAAISANGNPVKVNYVPLAPFASTVARMAWNDGSANPLGYIRRLDLYTPAVPAVQLPTLSYMPPAPPSMFSIFEWSVFDNETGGAITIEIETMPGSGGSPILDIEYQIALGAWISLGSAVPGSFVVTGLDNDIEVEVRIRAVNSIGAGEASEAKDVTPTSP